MTAVEWLENKINDELEIYNNQWLLIENFIEQAKIIEKQQIFDAHENGHNYYDVNGISAEQYYNETYKK